MMSTRNFILPMAVASSLNFARGELYADGGFQEQVTSKCLDSWDYKGVDKSVTTLSGCVSIDDYKPYPLDEQSITEDLDVSLVAPIDFRTNMNFWCATEELYNPVNENRKTIWGYCLDTGKTVSEISATLEEGETLLLADGGFQTNLVECLDTWTFKEKLPDGSKIETEYAGCVSMEEAKPYPFAFGESDSGLISPQYLETSAASWCAVNRDVYNPAPEKTEENKFNWGYCLKVSGKSEYETASPVPPPTGNPTPLIPATSSPTVETSEYETNSPTEFPTAFVTQAPTSLPPSTGQGSTPAPTLDDSSEIDPSTPGAAGTANGDSAFTSIPFIAGMAVAGGFLVMVIIVAVVVLRSMQKERRRLSEEDETRSNTDEVTKMDLERNSSFSD